MRHGDFTVSAAAKPGTMPKMAASPMTMVLRMVPPLARATRRVARGLAGTLLHETRRSCLRSTAHGEAEARDCSRPSFGLPRSAAGLPSVQIRGRWRDARIVGCAGEVRRIGRHRYIFRAGAVVRERCRTGEARLQRIGTEQRVRVVGALSGEPVTKLTWYVAPTGVGSLPSQKTGGGRHAGLGRVKDAEGAAKRGAGVPILSCAKQDRRAQTRCKHPPSTAAGR
jgi:hypothetical protein